MIDRCASRSQITRERHLDDDGPHPPFYLQAELTIRGRTDSVLPPNFDNVKLSYKEKMAVIAVGKNPDRTEADVDERGRPINTVYQGSQGRRWRDYE